MSAYLDHAASSPLRPEALDAMLPLLTEHFGNPSGDHHVARRSRRALEEARDELAGLLSVRPAQVVFTSGGTEADNLAILGAGGPGMVTTGIEHHAVLEPSATHEAIRVAATAEGVVDIEQLEASIRKDTPLVSVMTANNETGVIQPMHDVAETVRRANYHAVLHTDAVQAAAWLEPADFIEPADLVSVSGHKVGGPKGIGALIIRNDKKVRAQVLGGGQEQERRSGTPNVAGAVGMAVALRCAHAQRTETTNRVRLLRDRFIEEVRRLAPSAVLSGAGASRLPGHAHFRFPGIESEALLVLLDEAGVAASAGASCASGALEPSHVLLAMGCDPLEADSGVRFSFGWSSSEEDADLAVKAMHVALDQLAVA